MNFVILIALILHFPIVYGAELPLPSCSTEKPFRMDDSICSSFKEVCIKTDSTQCRTLLNACSQCPPSEYTVSMLATVNMKINELSNLTKKDISDLSSMMKKDISGLSNLTTKDIIDLSSMVIKNISDLSNMMKKEINELSNLTKKDISDLSSMMKKDISELSNLTKKDISNVFNMIKKSIGDLSIMQMNISELFSIKKEINETRASEIKGVETNLSNHHSWLVALSFIEIIITVIILVIIIITLKNQQQLSKCYKRIFKTKDPTTKVEIPLMQAALDENMNTISSELKAMLKTQEAINAKLLTDSQKAQEDLAELNSKLDEIKKSLVEKVDDTETGLISKLNEMSRLFKDRMDAIDANLKIVTEKAQEDHEELNSKLDKMEKQMDDVEAKLNTVTQKAQEDHLNLDSKLDRMKDVLTGKEDVIFTKLNSKLDEMNKPLTEKMDAIDAKLNSKLDEIKKCLPKNIKVTSAEPEAGMSSQVTTETSEVADGDMARTDDPK